MQIPEVITPDQFVQWFEQKYKEYPRDVLHQEWADPR